jgi:DNA-directed RNA polymerase specialized sigma24 family protein
VASLQELLDAGVSYQDAAQRLGVKSETVRKGIRRGILHAKKKAWRWERRRVSAV